MKRPSANQRGATHTIRVDAEVKARLDAERRPGERNYNEAIKRLLARREEKGGSRRS
jgi:hypothetical protein